MYAYLLICSYTAKKDYSQYQINYHYDGKQNQGSLEIIGFIRIGV